MKGISKSLAIIVNESEDPNIIKQEFDETGNVVLEIYITEEGIGYLEEAEDYKLVYFAFKDGLVDFAIHFTANEGVVKTGNLQLNNSTSTSDVEFDIPEI